MPFIFKTKNTFLKFKIHFFIFETRCMFLLKKNGLFNIRNSIFDMRNSIIILIIHFLIFEIGYFFVSPVKHSGT